MKNKLKIFILILLIIAVIVGIGYILFNAVHSINYNKNAKNPIVTMDIEGYGQIKMELYPEYAPNTVTNFVNLIQKGYYDGKVFFGVDGTAVQGGLIENTEENTEGTANTSKVKIDTLKASYIDSNIKEENDYEISINGEFADNGFKTNTLRFDYGIVGLYRNEYSGQTDLTSESYNSGNVRFFIETENSNTLNGRYAAFGKVMSGMEIIETIKNLPLDEGTSDIKYFQTLPKITKATVDTFGVDYGTPEYHEAFNYNKYISDLIMRQYSNQ